jgi:hypothetical protein|tara:strand:- start:315 stop:554 length:240 start_codon:yes stop_codon:yes gene_type:complete
MQKLLLLFALVLFSCSENTNVYEELAVKKAGEKNCNPVVELLLTYEDTELWSSYHNKDTQLLCVFTCVNDVCMFSTERD